MIILLVLFVLSVAACFWATDVQEEGWQFATGITAAIFGIMLLVAFCMNLSAQGDYGKLLGTKKSIAVIEESIQATSEAYYSEAGNVGLGVDLPNMKQSTNLTQAIADYRDLVIRFNRDVEYYHSMRRSFFGRMFYPSVPTELVVIETAGFGKAK